MQSLGIRIALYSPGQLRSSAVFVGSDVRIMCLSHSFVVQIYASNAIFQIC